MIDSKWQEIYYELTAKGRKIHLLRRAFTTLPNQYAILWYFRKYKTQPRSLAQIWQGIRAEYSLCTKKGMISGIVALVRKRYLKRD